MGRAGLMDPLIKETWEVKQQLRELQGQFRQLRNENKERDNQLIWK